MIKEEVDFVFPLFEVVETGNIERKALTDWVVRYFIFAVVGINRVCFLLLLGPVKVIMATKKH